MGNIKLREPCEAYGLWRKHAKYDKGFEGANFIFGALVMETTGAVNTEGTQILKQIFRFAAKRSGCHTSTYAGRAWARLSCNLQTSVAQAILNRASSREPALGDPDAEPDDFGDDVPSDMGFIEPFAAAAVAELAAAAADDEPAVELPPADETPATHDEPPATDEPPAIDDEPPAIDDEPPAVDDEPPVADDEPPAADDEPPAADDEPLAADPPVADDEPPVADDEPPAADDEPPATDEPPAAGDEPPAASKVSATTSVAAPASEAADIGLTTAAAAIVPQSTTTIGPQWTHAALSKSCSSNGDYSTSFSRALLKWYNFRLVQSIGATENSGGFPPAARKEEQRRTKKNKKNKKKFSSPSPTISRIALSPLCARCDVDTEHKHYN
jgi:hypothetical protein